eukprot:gene29737-39439_t
MNEESYTRRLDISPYEGIESYEYLDLSRRKLGLKGVIHVLEDASQDNIIKHINLSYNVTADEVENPKNMTLFIKDLKRCLYHTNSLIALDLGGNNLFHYSPHPFNEHLRNYLQELTTILIRSKIRHIDLSDNSIAGQGSRELKSLLEFVNKFILTRAQSFVCKSNNLNSQSFRVISNGLGIHSMLTYLDLSDNFGGMDPRKVANSEGIECICNLLAQSLNMKVLKLARNYLSDQDISMIFAAVESMPRMQLVDVSGNLCTLRQGADSLIQAISSHSVFDNKSDMGMKVIDISNNFLLDGKAAALAHIISRTASLTKVNFSQCSLSDKAISSLASGLLDNFSIIDFNIFANPEVTRKTGTLFQAEVEANILLSTITNDPLAVNCNELSNAVYIALQKKLRFLSKE